MGIAKSDEKVEIMKSEVVPERSKDDVTKDYEYTRGKSLFYYRKGTRRIINGILELAQESDQPRAYEVAG